MVKDFKALNLTICLWIFSPCVILLTFGLNKCNLFRITDFFSFIICLDEKLRKELNQKPHLAVLNACLRKLSFFQFYCKDFTCVLTLICLYEVFRIVDVWFLCCGDVSTMWDLLYLLMDGEIVSPFFPHY